MRLLKKFYQNNGVFRLYKESIYINKRDVLFILIKNYCFYYGYSYAFFMNHWISMLVALFSLNSIQGHLMKVAYNRQVHLLEQLGDYFYSVRILLVAGKSFEQSLIIVYANLAVTEQIEEKIFVNELGLFVSQIENGVEFTGAVRNLAMRIDIEMFTDFSSSLGITLKRGGDIKKLLKLISDVIKEKVHSQLEIKSITNGKKFELKLLKIMPVILILILNMTNSDYISVNYTTLGGRVVMLSALLLIGVSNVVASKIGVIES